MVVTDKKLAAACLMDIADRILDGKYDDGEIEYECIGLKRSNGEPVIGFVVSLRYIERVTE